MKRTSKIIAMLGLALPALYFGSVSEAAAFCVYNHTDLDIEVAQIQGGIFGDSAGHIPKGSFHKVIKPGKKACCNWKTKSCNHKGRRDSLVGFKVKFPADTDWENMGLDRCGGHGLDVKAGGWLTVSGQPPNLKCKAHFDK